MASPNSTASSSAHQSSRSTSQHGALEGADDAIPVETLVHHLLEAKRSLSSMSLVLRANDLVTAARQAHEEAVILGAQAEFLRRGITLQVRLLLKVRKSLTRTYENGKREFKQVIKHLDATNGRLEEMMTVLRTRTVDSAFRPQGEEKKCLLDFLDVDQVDTMRNALKENIGALQATQTSFDGDLLRFENDLRGLNKTLSASASPLSPSASDATQPIIQLLASMMDNSHEMAELLTSLTKHFDLCVTAVRITEGGVALARRRAAEVTQSQDGREAVSISGVIPDQDPHAPELDSISAQERANIPHVVVQDAAEVYGVIEEISARLQALEDEFARLEEQTNQIKHTYVTTIGAFHVLEDIGTRLQSYIASESEYRDRWQDEHQSITEKMGEMDSLRAFYETYAHSYDNLVLEADRRRIHEEKVLSVWRKAKESVDKLIDIDQRQRDTFRQEVAEYIPTDLWAGMDEGMRKWEVVPVRDNGGVEGSSNTASLSRSVVKAAAERLDRHDRASRTK
ncbi:autophagy-related protein 17 [Apiospora kogelbergensis]|uniref:Autophagy-related protein 17 n=1 Tax=Apiospora kogelbergensis TaxID=1337665 RepID=A0AAW0RBB3_9PEZI